MIEPVFGQTKFTATSTASTVAADTLHGPNGGSLPPPTPSSNSGAKPSRRCGRERAAGPGRGRRQPPRGSHRRRSATKAANPLRDGVPGRPSGRPDPLRARPALDAGPQPRRRRQAGRGAGAGARSRGVGGLHR
jgi:hypothetical protein